MSYQKMPREDLIFSKLKTGTWPDINKVLDKVREYMPTSNL